MLALLDLSMYKMYRVPKIYILILNRFLSILVLTIDSLNFCSSIDIDYSIDFGPILILNILKY